MGKNLKLARMLRFWANVWPECSLLLGTQKGDSNGHPHLHGYPDVSFSVVVVSYLILYIIVFDCFNEEGVARGHMLCPVGTPDL